MSGFSRMRLFSLLALAGLGLTGCNWSGAVVVKTSPGDMEIAPIVDMSVGSVDFGPNCQLNSCQAMSATCGPIGDGCGGSIDCGSCTALQTCGGGGTLFQCGGMARCIPLTCPQLGLSCGPAGDGCNNQIDCGTCPPLQT